MPSALRLNMLDELVTYASRTPSSTPELTSLMTSAVGPEALTVEGIGFWLCTACTGAVEISATAPFGLSGAASIGGGDWPSDRQTLTMGREAKARPKLQFKKSPLFIRFELDARYYCHTFY
jgi:hypothetical protein